MSRLGPGRAGRNKELLIKTSKLAKKLFPDLEKDIPAEKIAQAIIDIQDAVNKKLLLLSIQLNRSQLKREALVDLIHDNSKVAKSTIRIVLNNLDELERNVAKDGF